MKIRSFDIHSHLLPGVDDGFKTAEESLQAISRMAEAGCREFVFTPHMNPDVYPDSSEAFIKAEYDKFVKLIPAELGVKTSLAAEYMVVKDFEKRVEEDPKSLLTYGRDLHFFNELRDMGCRSAGLSVRIVSDFLYICHHGDKSSRGQTP